MKAELALDASTKTERSAYEREPETARPTAIADSAGAAVLAPVPAAMPVAATQVAQAAPSGSAPKPTAPPRESITQTGSTNGAKLITLDFKDADVVNVLR